MTWLFLPRSSCISIFCRKRSCHLFSVTRLQTLVLFFLCFSAFWELQCLFYKNFCLNIYYRNILLRFGLEQVNIYEINKKHFFLNTPPTNSQYKIFHKTVNENKLKVWKFQSHRFSGFLAIKRSVTGVERRRG